MLTLSVLVDTLHPGGEVDHLPALETLSVRCGQVEATISSRSLLKVAINGFPGNPFPVR